VVFVESRVKDSFERVGGNPIAMSKNAAAEVKMRGASGTKR